MDGSIPKGKKENGKKGQKKSSDTHIIALYIFRSQKMYQIYSRIECIQITISDIDI